LFARPRAFARVGAASSLIPTVTLAPTRVFLFVVSLSVVALAAAPALADQSAGAAPSIYAKPGLYVSLTGGGLIKTFKSTGDPLADLVFDALSNGAYIGGKFGSRMNRWLASETTIDYGVKGFDFEGGGGKWTNNPLYVTGTLKLFATDGRAQPYVGFGIGGAWLFVEASGFPDPVPNGKGTDSSFFARVGGGLDFWFNEHVALGPELWWNITTGDLEILRSLSIGADLTFKF
jgi:outer membrane protein W